MACPLIPQSKLTRIFTKCFQRYLLAKSGVQILLAILRFSVISIMIHVYSNSTVGTTPTHQLKLRIILIHLSAGTF